MNLDHLQERLMLLSQYKANFKFLGAKLTVGHLYKHLQLDTSFVYIRGFQHEVCFQHWHFRPLQA